MAGHYSESKGWPRPYTMCPRCRVRVASGANANGTRPPSLGPTGVVTTRLRVVLWCVVWCYGVCCRSVCRVSRVCAIPFTVVPVSRESARRQHPCTLGALVPWSGRAPTEMQVGERVVSGAWL